MTTLDFATSAAAYLLSGGELGRGANLSSTNWLSTFHKAVVSTADTEVAFANQQVFPPYAGDMLIVVPNNPTDPDHPMAVCTQPLPGSFASGAYAPDSFINAYASTSGSPNASINPGLTEKTITFLPRITTSAYASSFPVSKVSDRGVYTTTRVDIQATESFPGLSDLTGQTITVTGQVIPATSQINKAGLAAFSTATGASYLVAPITAPISAILLGATEAAYFQGYSTTAENPNPFLNDKVKGVSPAGPRGLFQTSYSVGDVGTPDILQSEFLDGSGPGVAIVYCERDLRTMLQCPLDMEVEYIGSVIIPPASSNGAISLVCAVDYGYVDQEGYVQVYTKKYATSLTFYGPSTALTPVKFPLNFISTPPNKTHPVYLLGVRCYMASAFDPTTPTITLDGNLNVRCYFQNFDPTDNGRQLMCLVTGGYARGMSVVRMSHLELVPNAGNYSSFSDNLLPPAPTEVRSKVYALLQTLSSTNMGFVGLSSELDAFISTFGERETQRVFYRMLDTPEVPSALLGHPGLAGQTASGHCASFRSIINFFEKLLGSVSSGMRKGLDEWDERSTTRGDHWREITGRSARYGSASRYGAGKCASKDDRGSLLSVAPNAKLSRARFGGTQDLTAREEQALRDHNSGRVHLNEQHPSVKEAICAKLGWQEHHLMCGTTAPKKQESVAYDKAQESTGMPPIHFANAVLKAFLEMRTGTPDSVSRHVLRALEAQSPGGDLSKAETKFKARANWILYEARKEEDEDEPAASVIPNRPRASQRALQAKWAAEEDEPQIPARLRATTPPKRKPNLVVEEEEGVGLKPPPYKTFAEVIEEMNEDEGSDNGSGDEGEGGGGGSEQEQEAAPPPKAAQPPQGRARLFLQRRQGAPAAQEPQPQAKPTMNRRAGLSSNSTNAQVGHVLSAVVNILDERDLADANLPWGDIIPTGGSYGYAADMAGMAKHAAPSLGMARFPIVFQLPKRTVVEEGVWVVTSMPINIYGRSYDQIDIDNYTFFLDDVYNCQGSDAKALEETLSAAAAMLPVKPPNGDAYYVSFPAAAKTKWFDGTSCQLALFAALIGAPIGPFLTGHVLLDYRVGKVGLVDVKKEAIEDANHFLVYPGTAEFSDLMGGKKGVAVSTISDLMSYYLFGFPVDFYKSSTAAWGGTFHTAIREIIRVTDQIEMLAQMEDPPYQQLEDLMTKRDKLAGVSQVISARPEVAPSAKKKKTPGAPASELTRQEAIEWDKSPADESEIQNYKAAQKAAAALITQIGEGKFKPEPLPDKDFDSIGIGKEGWTDRIAYETQIWKLANRTITSGMTYYDKFNELPVTSFVSPKAFNLHMQQWADGVSPISFVNVVTVKTPKGRPYTSAEMREHEKNKKKKSSSKKAPPPEAQGRHQANLNRLAEMRNRRQTGATARYTGHCASADSSPFELINEEQNTVKPKWDKSSERHHDTDVFYVKGLGFIRRKPKTEEADYSMWFCGSIPLHRDTCKSISVSGIAKPRVVNDPFIGPFILQPIDDESFTAITKNGPIVFTDYPRSSTSSNPKPEVNQNFQSLLFQLHTRWKRLNYPTKAAMDFRNALSSHYNVFRFMPDEAVIHRHHERFFAEFGRTDYVEGIAYHGSTTTAKVSLFLGQFYPDGRARLPHNHQFHPGLINLQSYGAAETFRDVLRVRMALTTDDAVEEALATALQFLGYKFDVDDQKVDDNSIVPAYTTPNQVYVCKHCLAESLKKAGTFFPSELRLLGAPPLHELYHPCPRAPANVGSKWILNALTNRANRDNGITYAQNINQIQHVHPQTTRLGRILINHQIYGEPFVSPLEHDGHPSSNLDWTTDMTLAGVSVMPDGFG